MWSLVRDRVIQNLLFSQLYFIIIYHLVMLLHQLCCSVVYSYIIMLNSILLCRVFTLNLTPGWLSLYTNKANVLIHRFWFAAVLGGNVPFRPLRFVVVMTSSMQWHSIELVPVALITWVWFLRIWLDILCFFNRSVNYLSNQLIHQLNDWLYGLPV